MRDSSPFNPPAVTVFHRPAGESFCPPTASAYLDWIYNIWDHTQSSSKCTTRATHPNHTFTAHLALQGEIAIPGQSGLESANGFYVWVSDNCVSKHTAADRTAMYYCPLSPPPAGNSTIFPGEFTEYSIECQGKLDVVLHSKQAVRVTRTDVAFIPASDFKMFSQHAVQAKEADIVLRSVGVHLLDGCLLFRCCVAGSHVTATRIEKPLSIPLVAPVRPHTPPAAGASIVPWQLSVPARLYTIYTHVSYTHVHGSLLLETAPQLQ